MNSESQSTSVGPKPKIYQKPQLSHLGMIKEKTAGSGIPGIDDVPFFPEIPINVS